MSSATPRRGVLLIFQRGGIRGSRGDHGQLVKPRGAFVNIAILIIFNEDAASRLADSIAASTTACDHRRTKPPPTTLRSALALTFHTRLPRSSSEPISSGNERTNEHCLVISCYARTSPTEWWEQSRRIHFLARLLRDLSLFFSFLWWNVFFFFSSFSYSFFSITMSSWWCFGVGFQTLHGLEDSAMFHGVEDSWKSVMIFRGWLWHVGVANCIRGMFLWIYYVYGIFRFCRMNLCARNILYPSLFFCLWIYKAFGNMNI